MCGRYVQTKGIEKYMRRLGANAYRKRIEFLTATWNLAPSCPSWVVRNSENELEAAQLKWGLSDGTCGLTPINARVETAATKQMFWQSWQERRCVVPADGWYEWKEETGGKQPYYLTSVDGEPILFAGLWTAETFCMFTTAADGGLTAVHHRKPLALNPDDANEWLRRPMTADTVISRAVPADAFRFYAVSKAVSNWRNDGPKMIEPLALPAKVDDLLL